ncbi:MAG: hypothetical protein ACRD3D_18235 [Terriglobia bacterium]
MLTFHKTIAGCEAADALAWRGFIADYSPVFLTISRIYLPAAAPDPTWKETLGGVAADNYTLLRGFEHQSEREFLSGLREYHLGSRALSLGAPQGQMPELSRAGIEATLHGLPLVHQEVIFLKLAGYSDATLEKMFRITPSVAAGSVARLAPAYAGALGSDADAGWQPSAWLKLLTELWKCGEESCPPLRLLIRIQDGQVGWQEKQPAEKRLAECLHCMERWTALKELSYWRSAAPPITPDQIESFLAAVPVREETPKSKPLLKRLFG